MPDFHGPIQHVTIAGTLWLILAFPVLVTIGLAVYAAWGALVHPAGARRLPPDARTREGIAILSVGSTAFSLAVIAYHAWVLSTKPADERYLLQHLWRMVRVGQLDASFDLAFDPLSAAVACAIAGIGVSTSLRCVTAMKRDPSYVRFFFWMNGLVAATLLLVLADNFVLLLLGGEGVGLCAWGLVGFRWLREGGASAGRRAFLVSRVGDVGLVLGIAVLYWGLGGAWDNTDYVPDLSARFSSVEVGPLVPPEPAVQPSAVPPQEKDEEDEARAPALPPTTGEGFLTLTGYSGAAVFMDDARTPLQRAPGEPLRAPFARFPVKGGLHSFRIQLGSGLEDSLVTHVAFGGDREIALTSFGPTVTFRNVRDQLTVQDVHGRAPVREAFLAKHTDGTGRSATVLTLACLLFLVGAAAKSAQLLLHVWLPAEMAGPTRASTVFLAATAVTTGGYLVARLSFLFALSPAASAALAVLGGATLLLAAASWLYKRSSPPAWLDALYTRGFGAVAHASSEFFAELDDRVLGGFVNAGALATRAVAWTVAHADDALVDGAVRRLSEGTLRVGGRLQRLQSGRVQTYVLVIVFGVIALAFLPYWLR